MLPAAQGAPNVYERRSGQVFAKDSVAALTFNGGRPGGSAVHVQLPDGGTILLTCNHVIQQSLDFTATFPSGRSYPVRATTHDKTGADIALLTADGIEEPAVRVAPNDPQPGARIWKIGYAMNAAAQCPLSITSGTVTGQDSMLAITAQAWPGDSGGGIFEEHGLLVGTLSQKNLTLNRIEAVPCCAIRAFLKRWHDRQHGSTASKGREPAPVTQPSADPGPVAKQPDPFNQPAPAALDEDRLVEKIIARLPKPAPGEKGLPGLDGAKGSPGPRGEPGPPGTDADPARLAALEAKIAALEQQIAQQPKQPAGSPPTRVRVVPADQ